MHRVLARPELSRPSARTSLVKIWNCSITALYCVTTKRLNEQVRRNHSRFPADFLIQLTADEAMKKGRGYNVKYLPLAFTEHGAIMAAMVLNSPRAVLASNTTLSRRLEAPERSVAALDSDTRKQFDHVYEAILGLMGSGPRRN